MREYNKKEHDQFVAGVIYKDMIEREGEWRKANRDTHDYKMKNKMLEEVRELGYNYEYFKDICVRDNRDPKFLEIAMKYVGCFENEGITAELIDVIGKKGNTEATKIILERFNSYSEKEKRLYADCYDNALLRIADKRYIDDYLQLLKQPEVAYELPFMMEMLGRWKVEEAKPYFMDYLDSTLNHYVSKFEEESIVSNLVFIAVEALKYYTDLDGEISKKLRTKLGSGNKELEKQVNKALERIEKNNLKALQGRKKKTCK